MSGFDHDLTSSVLRAAKEPSPPENEPTEYHPNVEDVFRVRALLLSISSFPLELIDTIIDVAEYWPCSTTLNTGRYSIRDMSWRPDNSGGHFLVGQFLPRISCRSILV